MHRFHTTRGSVITQTSMPSTTKVDALLARHKAALQYLYARINYERTRRFLPRDRQAGADAGAGRSAGQSRASDAGLSTLPGRKARARLSAMIGCILRASGSDRRRHRTSIGSRSG